MGVEGLSSAGLRASNGKGRHARNCSSLPDLASAVAGVASARSAPASSSNSGVVAAATESAQRRRRVAPTSAARAKVVKRRRTAAAQCSISSRDSGRAEPMQEVPDESVATASVDSDAFDAARERTRQALRQLAERWQGVPHPPDSAGADAGVAGAAARLAVAEGNGAAESAEDALIHEGFEWSRKVGLAYVLPSGALRNRGGLVRPVARSVDMDELHASTAGGAGMRTHPGLLVAPAPPCGYGVFATTRLRCGEKLGEYTGQVRNYEVWVEEIRQRKLKARGKDVSVPFIAEELYAAWTGSGPAGAGVVIDAFCAGNGMRFINCSCCASCSFKPFGASAENHHRLEVVTLRDIEPGEQLSVDYGWYFDPATLEDVRAQAVEAYNEDRVGIRALSCSLPDPSTPMGPCSDALKALAATLCKATGAGVSSAPAEAAVGDVGFPQRFVDVQAVSSLFEQIREAGSDGILPEAHSIREIPDALWPLYEVAGAARVGIPCRCALEPSLNQEGKCSGIIGRPLQDKLCGRDDAVTADMGPNWL